MDHRDETIAIRVQMERTTFREHSTPMFLTSSFVYHSAEHAAEMFAGKAQGDIYSRFTNPNTTELIDKVCALEKAEAGIVTASGMAAIFNTLAAHLSQGDEVVAAAELFGNTSYILTQILPTWGIKSTIINTSDKTSWEAAIKRKPKMVMIESPTNPGLELFDIKWLGQLCQANGVIFCVDNCFASPILQKPMLLGADLVIHSATKWMDGQGRVLGGIVVGKEQYVTPIFNFLRRTGASLSPFNAWILSKSIETLSVRIERHCENALRIATFLEAHDAIVSVRYPFLPSHPQFALAKEQMKMGGGIVTFTINGDLESAFKFINSVKIPSITANLGDSRSIVTNPWTTTHSKLSDEEKIAAGISPATIRMSVGLESIDDLLQDLEQALNQLN